MKIGILFNCHGEGMSAALRAMLPDAEIFYQFTRDARSSPDVTEAIAAELRACDHVFSQPLNNGWGLLGNEAMARAMASYHVLPPFGFRGFHPDMMRVLDGDTSIMGPTGAYQSRIAVAGFLAGLEAVETAGLYNALVFDRLGYFQSYALDMALLTEQFAQYGVDAGPMMARLRAQGCFMHSYDHPKVAPTYEMARAACALMGVAPREIDTASLPDCLAVHPGHPVFPEIAAALGVPAENMFHASLRRGDEPVEIGTLDFVAGSFEAFAKTDRALMRRANGVAQAMAALGLSEPPARPQRARAGAAQLLMTWHGTLVRQAPAEGAPLRHLPLRVSEAQAPYLRFTPREDIAGGRLEAAPHAGMVAVAKGRRYLSASNGSAQATPDVRFAREAVGDSECFLPVPVAELQDLADLLEGGWVHETTLHKTPAQARLVAGPAVVWNGNRIELALHWPRALQPGPDGRAAMEVMLDGQRTVLRQMVAPRAAAPAPTVGAQAVAGRGLVFTGDPILLHLPMTLNNAHRLWLHATCGDAGGLPWQENAGELRLSRETDQPMRFFEPDGAADHARQTVLETPSVLVAPPGQAPYAGQWADCLLRLLVMARYLPPGMEVVAPGGEAGAAALAEGWRALGLPPIAMRPAPAGACVAREVAWLDKQAAADWPAETLAAARAVWLARAAEGASAAAGAKPGEDRVFVRGPASAAVKNLAALLLRLPALGVAVLDTAALPPATVLSRLRQAGVLIGVGEDLNMSAFCATGTKVLELAGATFHPAAWRLSCRMGLVHAVLPCGAAFDVSVEPLMNMFRMLNQRCP